MANYYMSGYTPPDGVDSAYKVKEYQRRLGVKADGIWGPKTEAAYRAGLESAAQAPRFDWGGGGSRTFDSCYTAIKNSLAAPHVSVKAPDRREVASMWSGVLRPAADAAIKRRGEAARENMAETDADAASRGMGASSYVTSVKAREMRDAQDDIADIEARYGAALAERIYDTLAKYDQMGFDARKYNAQADAAAGRTALDMASDWYRQYLARQREALKAGSRGGGGRGRGGSGKGGLSTADYLEYVDNLTGAQRKLLFNSAGDYWSSRRDEIYSAVGSALYDNLRKKYGV